MVVDLIGSGTPEPGVGPAAVEPGEVERQLVDEGGETVRDRDQTPRALDLDGSDAPLDYGQAAVLANGAESMADAPAATPALETLRRELSALVGDEVLWLIAILPGNSFQESANCCGARFATIDREPHHAPREVIDGHGEPPAKRPDLRNSKRQPGGPEAERRGNSRQIHMPQVIGVPGGDDAGRLFRGTARSWPFPIAKHPAHGCWGEAQTGASEDLGDLHFSESGAWEFQASHQVADELGKAIDRFGQLDERVGPLLIEPCHPGGDCERAHLKDPRRLGERPATDGAKLENGQSRCLGVVGSSVGLDLLHSGVLDASLFPQELNLLPKPVLFSPLSKLGVHALGSPTPSQRQGGPGKGETWTTAERTRRRGQPKGSGRGRTCGGRGVTNLPKEFRDNGLAVSLTY